MIELSSILRSLKNFFNTEDSEEAQRTRRRLFEAQSPIIPRAGILREKLNYYLLELEDFTRRREDAANGNLKMLLQPGKIYLPSITQFNVMRLLITFIFSVFCYLSYAQQQTVDSLKAVYKKEAILLHLPFYFKGAERFNFKELRTEFSNSPTGLLEFEQGMKQYRTAKIFTITAIAASLSSIFVFRSNRNLGYGLLGGSFVVNMIGARLSFSGSKHIHQAVYIRNQDVLFGSSR